MSQSATQRKRLPAGALTRALLSVVLATAVAACTQDQSAADLRYARSTDKPFADVMIDLELAITQENFAITARNNLGDPIRRRGHPDFPDAHIVSFCNLEYARRAIDIDPALMVYMPCKVTVLAQGETVLIQTYLLPEALAAEGAAGFAREVNSILRGIVDFAASGD